MHHPMAIRGYGAVLGALEPESRADPPFRVQTFTALLDVAAEKAQDGRSYKTDVLGASVAQLATALKSLAQGDEGVDSVTPQCIRATQGLAHLRKNRPGTLLLWLLVLQSLLSVCVVVARLAISPCFAVV